MADREISALNVLLLLPKELSHFYGAMNKIQKTIEVPQTKEDFRRLFIQLYDAAVENFPDIKWAEFAMSGDAEIIFEDDGVSLTSKIQSLLEKYKRRDDDEVAASAFDWNKAGIAVTFFLVVVYIVNTIGIDIFQEDILAADTGVWDMYLIGNVVLPILFSLILALMGTPYFFHVFPIAFSLFWIAKFYYRYRLDFDDDFATTGDVARLKLYLAYAFRGLGIGLEGVLAYSKTYRLQRFKDKIAKLQREIEFQEDYMQKNNDEFQLLQDAKLTDPRNMTRGDKKSLADFKATELQIREKKQQVTALFYDAQKLDAKFKMPALPKTEIRRQLPGRSRRTKSPMRTKKTTTRTVEEYGAAAREEYGAAARYTNSEIQSVLKETDGDPVAAAAKLARLMM